MLESTPDGAKAVKMIRPYIRGDLVMTCLGARLRMDNQCLLLYPDIPKEQFHGYNIQPARNAVPGYV